MLRISIITPSFNQAAFIEQTIKSVLSQKYPNLEYWVIDGGSKDGTIDILKRHSHKLKWVSQRDSGQTNAINKGLQKVNGDVVGYLNSDDLLTKDSLKTIASYFSKKNVDWLIGDYQIIDEKGMQIKKQQFIEVYKRFLLKNYSIKNLIRFNNFIPQPSTFWSKKALKTAGLLDESLVYAMDYEYWLRLASCGFEPLIVGDLLSRFRLHHESKSGSQRQKMLTEAYQVISRYTHKPFDRATHALHAYLMRFIYQFV